MDIARKLAKLGIEQVKRLDNETIRLIAYNVTEALTKAFPIMYDEYNNILSRLLSCQMYLAKVTKPISKVNYIYEDNSIYFDEQIKLDKINEQMIHECIHYLQDCRDTNGKLDKIGLCNFEDFTIYGLGLNEAVVQYMSAKCVKNETFIIEKYGVVLKTISPSYYPFLTNLAEQLIYLLGEEILIKGTLNGSIEFEDYLLNTFENNTKKIISKFDRIIKMNNALSVEKDIKKIKILQQDIANTYIEAQKLLLKTYFDNICPRITSIQEIDFYMNKATQYENIIGVIAAERYNISFYDKYIEGLNKKLNQKLMQISKGKSKTALSIITNNKIREFIKRITSYFTI